MQILLVVAKRRSLLSRLQLNRSSTIKISKLFRCDKPPLQTTTRWHTRTLKITKNQHTYNNSSSSLIPINNRLKLILTNNRIHTTTTTATTTTINSLSITSLLHRLLQKLQWVWLLINAHMKIMRLISTTWPKKMQRRLMRVQCGQMTKPMSLA